MKQELENLANTDAGNGEAFALLHGDRVRYDHRRRRWLIWDETRWRPDSDGEVQRLAIQTARARLEASNCIAAREEHERAAKWALVSESSPTRRAMIQTAASLPPIADKGDSWDLDNWLLGCANGVIELRTGVLRPGRPGDRITLSTGIVYDAEAKCLRWTKFLEEVFLEPDLIAYIQRLIGYCLTGETTEQCFALCYGEGANGKGVFFRSISNVLGDYAANTPFSTFERHERNGIPNDLAALAGKRFVTASESGNVRLNEERIKAITGGDPISARFMRAEFFTYQPQFKIWLATNHKPRVEDDSRGFWRRVRLIPFSQTFEGDRVDKNLEDKLKAEAQGILKWAVEGCVLWREQGLNSPGQVIDATEDYQDECDLYSGFINDKCVLADDADVGATDLYKAYQQYAADNLGEPMTQTAFGVKMGSRGYKKERVSGRMTYFRIALAA